MIFKHSFSLPRSRPLTGFNFKRGFTLIELMMGAVVLAMIGVLTYGSLWGTFRTQKTVNDRTEMQETGTALISKIRDELSQTFFVESTKPLTTFKGEDNGNQDKIAFTALAHYPTAANAHESDQTELRYFLETNPQDNSLYLLKRVELPFLTTRENVAKVEFEALTVASNVTEFNIEYFDGQKYVKEWDMASVERRNKLPELIRVDLALRDDKNRTFYFQTVVDLPMAESLSVNTPQNPGTNATPNPNNPNPTPPDQNTPGNPQRSPRSPQFPGGTR